MKIDVFGKPGCARCESTKAKLTHFLSKWQMADRVPLDFVSLDTADGLARGAFNDVFDQVPVTIVFADDNRPVARWEGDVPPSDEVARILGVQA
jgi:hypothetical protein